MDINKQIESLFTKQNKILSKNRKQTDIDKNSSKQINNINYYLENKNKNKIKNKDNNFKIVPHTDIVFDNEIDYTLQNKSWKNLDICFKSRIIDNYLYNIQPNVNSADIENIKNMIIKKQNIDVEYDKITKSIKKLNYKTLDNRLI